MLCALQARTTRASDVANAHREAASLRHEGDLPGGEDKQRERRRLEGGSRYRHLWSYRFRLILIRSCSRVVSTLQLTHSYLEAASVPVSPPPTISPCRLKSAFDP